LLAKAERFAATLKDAKTILCPMGSFEMSDLAEGTKRNKLQKL
jgi:3-phosphoglycerate kinase